MITQQQPAPLGAHEFVSRMTRYRALSAERLNHMKTITRSRLDLVVPLRCLKIEPDLKANDIILQVLPVTAQEAGSQEAYRELNAAIRERAFRLTRNGLADLLGQIKLPTRHFDAQVNGRRIALLCDYFNACREHESLAATPLVVRVLQGDSFSDDETSGVIRAIASTAYQRFDASDLMEHLIPRIESGELLLLKAHVSHHGENVQIVLASPGNAFRFDPKAGTHGDTLHRRTEAVAGPNLDANGDDDGTTYLPGVSISLSETGSGAVKMEPMIIRSVCVNGAICATWGKRKVHITGERSGVGVAWATDTVSKKRDASIAEMRDVIKHCMSEAITLQFTEALGRAAGTKVELESLKTLINARLKKESGISEAAVDRICDLFSAQFSVRNGETMFDAAQALTEFREFDSDPVINPLLETVSGELLLKA